MTGKCSCWRAIPSGGKLITDVKELRPGLDPNSTYFAGYANAADLSPIGAPDNIGFDPDGNLWIVTDGAQPGKTNNGCYVCPTAGPDRGKLQQFMSGPMGAEICGCQFSPDGKTLFLSIQHPGEGGSVASPISHWPDGPGTQPRCNGDRGEEAGWREDRDVKRRVTRSE